MKIYNGMGLIKDLIVLVHYDDAKRKSVGILKRKFLGKNIIFLRDRDSVIILNNSKNYYINKF